MSLQPLSPEIQDILRRAMRTQYVVLPAQAQPDSGDDDQEIEIIQQLLNPRIYFEDFLLQSTQTANQQVTNQQVTNQTQVTEQTEQVNPNNQADPSNKITKAQALSLRLVLGFIGALLLVLGLLTAISSDYLDQITSSIKEIFAKEE